VELPCQCQRNAIEDINLKGLENDTIGLHSSDVAKYGLMTTMNQGNN